MKWRWLLVLILAYAAWNAWQSRPVTHAPCVLAAAAPEQNELAAPLPAFERAGYRVTPLQSFALEARVLAAERYRFGREADLSPVDLALGWGAMSDSAVLDGIEISQANRFYFWRTHTWPVSRRVIERHSANWHVIAGSDAVRATLDRLRAGSVVELEGELVDIEGREAGMATSLTRNDTGPGACEILLASSARVLK